MDAPTVTAIAAAGLPAVNANTLPAWMFADLKKSAIPHAAAAALGWRSTAEGYEIPFRHPETGEALRTPDGRPFTRVRLRNPSATCKYLSPQAGGQFPFILPDVHRHLLADTAAPVIVSEGEKKALSATLAGLLTVGLCGIDSWNEKKGSRAVHPLLRHYLTPGRTLVMVYDSDAGNTEKAATFERSAARFAAAVEALGCEFSRVILPALPDGKKAGLDDLIAAGWDSGKLREYIETHRETVHARRPLVMLPGGSRSNLEFIRETAAAVASHASLFVRNGELVTVEVNDLGAPEFVPLSASAVTSELELFAAFARPGKDGETAPATLPETGARMLLAAPEFHRRMPKVRRLCDYPAPVWRDGEIILPPPGYSPDLETFTREDAPPLEKFTNPEAAVLALQEILGEFCFAEGPEGKADLFRAAGLAWLLTAHCRLLYEPERAPLFYFEGNRPGTGKDLLAGLAVVLTCGTLPPFFAPPKDSDESRKRIFSLARAGARFYLLSNVKGHLDDAALEAACTSPVMSDRVLGESVERSFPNIAIYGLSGNGLTYTEDLARRAIRVRLEFLGECVETRSFSHPDLYGFALAARGRYLGALQCLVETWKRAGCPKGTKAKASFSRWAETVGGILEACEIFNPIGQDEMVSAPTEEVLHMRRLLAAWNETHGPAEVDAGKVRELAREHDLFTWIDTADRAGQTKFSRMLARHVGRNFGGLRVLKREAARGNSLWRVSPAEVTA